jgi:uncharacterized RDD family membrane protein YckC
MSQITILNDANQPTGPFTRSEVANKLQSGEVRLTSLAFIEGLQQWTPLRDVLARVDAIATPPPGVPPPLVPPPLVPPAAAPFAAPPASGYVPAYTAAPPPVTSGYSYAASMQPPGHLVYAGFWLRFAAIIVDGLVFLPFFIIQWLVQAGAQATDDTSLKLGLSLVALLCAGVVFFGQWLYFALMESGPWQATLGKKLLGIRVTGLDGGRIGFGRATGRYFGKILSALIFYIGFLMAAFTDQKQGLHDMIAGTLVVRT